MMNVFNMMVQEIRLVDVGFKGQYFMWNNNREGNQREMLDRASMRLGFVSSRL